MECTIAIKDKKGKQVIFESDSSEFSTVRMRHPDLLEPAEFNVSELMDAISKASQM